MSDLCACGHGQLPKAVGGIVTDNLRDRIAAVLIKHHTDCDDTVDGTWTQCECDAGWRREDEWAVHVSDVLIRELGLPPTWGKPSFKNGSADD